MNRVQDFGETLAPKGRFQCRVTNSIDGDETATQVTGPEEAITFIMCQYGLSWRTEETAIAMTMATVTDTHCTRLPDGGWRIHIVAIFEDNIQAYIAVLSHG